LNKIAILGAEESDVIAIRKCFQSRWPYPLTHDYEMMPVEGNPGGWFFKVRIPSVRLLSGFDPLST
jgi:hypothetical protein